MKIKKSVSIVDKIKRKKKANKNLGAGEKRISLPIMEELAPPSDSFNFYISCLMFVEFLHDCRTRINKSGFQSEHNLKPIRKIEKIIFIALFDVE